MIILQIKHTKYKIKHKKHNLNTQNFLITHIVIIGRSASGKTNALFNLISQEIDIDKLSLQAKDPNDAKYQLVINKQKNSSLKDFNDSKVFIEYLNDMYDTCI